jgi:hypothetical protein
MAVCFDPPAHPARATAPRANHPLTDPGRGVNAEVRLRIAADVGGLVRASQLRHMLRVRSCALPAGQAGRGL